MTSFEEWEGNNDECCMDEFRVNLQKPVVSSKPISDGWVFWYPKTESSYHVSLPLPTPEDKIKSFLEAVTPDLYTYTFGYCMLQFWGIKEGCLTTLDQPFAVVDHRLCKGYSWYRKFCEAHRYSVKSEEEAGPVGRVYLNRYPESTPDLRLYSVKEFPLRNQAARCGFTKYLALPLFDLLNNECYGVLELVSRIFLQPLDQKKFDMHLNLKNAGLKFRTHSSGFSSITAPHQTQYHQQESDDDDVAKMMELAIELVPQLQLVQLWSRCSQCVNATNNLSCVQRIAFIEAKKKTLNYCIQEDIEMRDYVEASEFHQQQMGKWIGSRALMSFDTKSCFCRNICDFSISENPLAHYAQRARLSFCFVVRLQNVHNNNIDYFAEFFFQTNGNEDGYDASFLHLLFMIMETKLKNFKFKKSIVELRKTGALTTYENMEWKHQHSEQVNMLMAMKGHTVSYSLSEFENDLRKAGLSCLLRPCEKHELGWVFGTEDALDNNTIFIQEKIKKLMIEIVTDWEGSSYVLVQFWALGMKEDRPCLQTSDQPFALTYLDKGLHFFRKQCMKFHYFVDEEVGPLQRVFRSGHPEISPDLRLYSITEFPLRDDAMHCHLQKYIAFPILDQQKKCIGVLECVAIDYEYYDNSQMIYSIQNALKAAGLGATHIDFLDSPLTRKVDQSRKLAEIELQSAFPLFENIPQLCFADPWVTHSECDSSSSNISCMELVKTFQPVVLPLLPIQFLQVQTGKGIAGMVLASENKSCFFRNLSHFSIAEEPRSHYLQGARLDVCFAICLKSSHTGDLLYVLQFFLYQGPAKYEYLSSFLHTLFPILKQELPSFKVASGQQLGDDLMVDVIEFPQRNQPTFPKLDESYSSPFKFKTVLYGQDEPQHFGKKIEHVAEELGVGRSYGIDRTVRTSQHSLCLPTLDTSFLPPTNAEIVMVKARYEDEIIKFKLCVSSTMKKLQEEVGKRLDLEKRSFKLRYLDEDNEKILLACDDDLQLCLKTQTAGDNKTLHLFVQLIPKLALFHYLICTL